VRILKEGFCLPGIGGDGSADRVLPLFDGKVLIMESFAKYQGVTRNGLARLKAESKSKTDSGFMVPMHKEKTKGCFP